jgi:hypothetical protein
MRIRQGPHPGCPQSLETLSCSRTSASDASQPVVQIELLYVLLAISARECSPLRGLRGLLAVANELPIPHLDVPTHDSLDALPISIADPKAVFVSSRICQDTLEMHQQTAADAGGIDAGDSKVRVEACRLPS